MKRENISPAEFPSFITDYTVYLTNLQGRSLHTTDQYLFDLRTFFRFLMARKNGIPFDSDRVGELDIHEVTVEMLGGLAYGDILQYVSYLSSVRGCSNSAISRQLSALRSLFKYLNKATKQIKTNPMADVETPKKKKTMPKWLTLDESLDLLKGVDDETDDKNRVRDYAILTLFLNCGMRVSELAGLTITDFSPDLDHIRVLGKGNKERILYLNDACRSALSAYLDIRLAGENAKINDKALFLSNRGQGMSVKTVQAMVYKRLNHAGLGAKHYSVHKLRHTAATLLYQNADVDVRVLQEMLGHEQLNTTQIYTHVASNQVREAMKKNPLAGEELKDS